MAGCVLQFDYEVSVYFNYLFHIDLSTTSSTLIPTFFISILQEYFPPGFSVFLAVAFMVLVQLPSFHVPFLVTLLLILSLVRF